MTIELLTLSLFWVIYSNEDPAGTVRGTNIDSLHLCESKGSTTPPGVEPGLATHLDYNQNVSIGDCSF